MDESETPTPTASISPSFSEKCPEKDDRWHLTDKVEEFNQRNLASGFKPRQLGVTWNNLTVKATSAKAAINENFVFQFDPRQHLSRFRRNISLQTILDQSHGCVKPGEMLLVLGRPGSGCTTLLKMLSNRRAGYDEISGDIRFGDMSPEEAENYRGQIVMNTEEEIFFPTLTVAETMRFATSGKVPAHLPEGCELKHSYQDELNDFLLRSLGISHTATTKVGNEYVRGVSGGERKRVSILECLAARGSIYCWDNSTRGLDASSALDWARAIRAITDVYSLSSIVTLYQAGNQIYDLFDKVLILNKGKQVYYSPISQARGFMEDLGFVCKNGTNVTDFLTGVTVPTKRQIRSGFETSFPRDATSIHSIYQQTDIFKNAIAEYSYPTTELARQRTRDFKENVAFERASKQSQYTVGFLFQVKVCVIRQYQIIAGDMVTFRMKQDSNIVQALIAGSLYYQASNDSSGVFIKGGVLFWSVLYNSITAMSEVVDSFTGRPIILKHKSLACIHPAAIYIAQIAADIPIIILQVTTWSLIIYFMARLVFNPSNFFTY
ncbi:unnamed protein product [Penicillium salamii]|nr:unnamed protein product [Penicillium salamii]